MSKVSTARRSSPKARAKKAKARLAKVDSVQLEQTLESEEGIKNIPISLEVDQQDITLPEGWDSFSLRDQQILTLSSIGYPQKEIGELAGISRSLVADIIRRKDPHRVFALSHAGKRAMVSSKLFMLRERLIDEASLQIKGTGFRDLMVGIGICTDKINVLQPNTPAISLEVNGMTLRLGG